MSRHTVTLVLLTVCLGWFAGCSRENPAPAAPQKPASETGATATDTRFQASLPQEGGPAGYAGSAACKACHEDQFASWHRSYHRTMTQYARPDTVQADFNNQTLTNGGVRFRLSSQDEELRVRMERIDTEPNSDAAPPALDTRMSLVTGSHHMQVFWMPGGDGNTQIGFPFTWLIPESRWVPRNTTFVRPPGTQHQSEIWNVTCSRCHATGIEPRVDAARRQMDSRAAELGISCEACHGPGERHVIARKADAPGRAPDPATLKAEIVQPERLDAKRASEVCGFCHSMKWIGPDEPWRGHGFRFRPGDDLEATTPLIQPAHADSIPGLREYLAKNPDLLRDYFWSDGMGRVSGREYNSVAQSPCFKGGTFSCLSCHSLHESEPSDLLAKNRNDNRACLQCHAQFENSRTLTAHTHHLAESSGSECYNCHMPHTTYGVLSAIRSHQISSPKVSDQLETGRPNACNLCHLDQSLAWTARHLSDWFQQTSPPLSPEQNQWAESVRLGLSGDAGQRALIAWHWGWKPAVAVSGNHWLAPVLGALLDDPYAAVRCLAERSLRQTGIPIPDGYDYVAEPGSRPAASAAIWSKWIAENSGKAVNWPASVPIRPDTKVSIESQLAPILNNRDHRPVRLRE